jgi:hypothetical protein
LDQEGKRTMKWEIFVFITGVSIVLLSIAIDDKLPEGTGDVMFRGAVIVVFAFLRNGALDKTETDPRYEYAVIPNCQELKLGHYQIDAFLDRLYRS